MGDIDISNIFGNFSKEMAGLTVATMVIITTLLGAHFATTSDLVRLQNSISDVREQFEPLEGQVDGLERDVITIDRDLAKTIERTDNLEREYQNIDISLERMSGRQDITNERLEGLRTLLRYGYNFDEDGPIRR